MRERGLNGESKILFADEMRVGLIGRITKVWAPRGVKILQKKEYTFKWAYLNLGVDVERGVLYWFWTDDISSSSIREVLRNCEQKGVDGIVWDRAKSHMSKEVRDEGIALIHQPPYSPELNPTERV